LQINLLVKKQFRERSNKGKNEVFCCEASVLDNDNCAAENVSEEEFLQEHSFSYGNIAIL